jgi:DNA-binding transcriptional regulator YhcF (GntR family)
MVSLSVETLFHSSAQILVLEEKLVNVSFSQGIFRIKFPTTRKLAEILHVPHYYVLPYIVMMEEQDLVTRIERVGIYTTKKGSIMLIKIIDAKYPEEGEKIFGKKLFLTMKGSIE